MGEKNEWERRVFERCKREKVICLRMQESHRTLRKLRWVLACRGSNSSVLPQLKEKEKERREKERWKDGWKKQT